jgi:hypothetical protein
MKLLHAIVDAIDAALGDVGPPSEVGYDDVHRRAVCLTLARRSVGPGASVYDVIAAADYLDHGPASDEGDDPDEGDDETADLTDYDGRKLDTVPAGPRVAGPYVPTDLR